MDLQSALINQLNSASFTAKNHSSDNCFSYNTPHEMEWAMQKNGMEPLGICLNPPYNPYSYPMIAIAFTEEDEFCWCHMSKDTWQSFIKRLYGEEKCNEISQK